MFCKKGFLRNFPNFPVTLLKKRPWNRCFPVNFVKFLRTPSCIEHLWWLLLTLTFDRAVLFENIAFSIAGLLLDESQYLSITNTLNIRQWNWKTLIGCVNNNQREPRFYLYKFLYCELSLKSVIIVHYFL